ISLSVQHDSDHGPVSFQHLSNWHDACLPKCETAETPERWSIVFSGKGDWFGHPKYYLGRTSTHGRQHLAWFRGGLATRFWVKGCLDPESDGASEKPHTFWGFRPGQ